MHRKSLALYVSCLLLFQACHVTYYQKKTRFHALFASNRLTEADALLAQDKRVTRRKTRLLHYLNRGVVAHLMQQYEASNYFFEQAYLTQESLFIKPLHEVLALISNPMVTDYRGEDHEVLLLHYYKALNFLQLGKNEAALVECRRLNIKLNQLSDKYVHTNKYRRDAFIHTLMGLVYQANHAYNDAFIAYRNAIEIYQEDYTHLFGLDVPTQLKKDLIYTAYKTGLHDQVTQYQQQFKIAYDPASELDLGDVVFIWNNGLGPVKDEWSIDFVLACNVGGVVTFSNEALGLCFPFPAPDNQENAAITDLKCLRVAFPKYHERPLLYDKAILCTDEGRIYTFEILEDINAIAFQVLRQRMIRELGKSLLRIAIKKAAEHQIRKQHQLLGAVVGGFNFLTEKADTRNWQTIPHSIFYTRIKLPEGAHRVTFEASAQAATQCQTFHFESRSNLTLFQIIHTLEADAY